MPLIHDSMLGELHPLSEIQLCNRALLNEW